MTLERLGPAVTGFPFSGATRVGDRLVIASRNLVPALLVTYDLTARRVIAVAEVPTGRGAWGVGSASETAGAAEAGQGPALAYAGQFGAMGSANLHRLDLASGQLDPIAALDAEYLWDIAVDPVDGRVYVVGSPDRVIRWDPTSGLATVVPDMDHVLDGVRSVAIAGRTLVVGGRHEGRAVLRGLNLDTGAVLQAAPAVMAGETLVYALAGTAEWVAAGTQGSGMRGAGVALLRAADLSVVDHAQLAEEAVVDALAVEPATAGPVAVLATARRSGRLYRVAAGAVTALGVPVQRSETRGLFLHGDAVVGVSAAEVVWSLDLRDADARIEHVDLLEAGLRRRPQLAMSIAAEGDGPDRSVHVGGNFTLTTHLGGGTPTTSHTFVPGEAKDLCVVDGDLYAAVYPAGQVLRRGAGESRFSLLAQLDPDQFRPVALVADPTRRQLLVSTARDRDVGALHAVALPGPGAGAGGLTMALDPFGDGQHPAGVAVDGDIAYLGGSGPRGALLAWDLNAWGPAWRIDAVRPQSGTWVGVAVSDGFVVLLGSLGWWVTVELATRAVAVGGRLGADGGQLLASGGAVHAITSDGLWRLEPARATATPVVEGLDSQLWGWPFLDADDTGVIHVIAGLDVARVIAAGSDPTAAIPR